MDKRKEEKDRWVHIQKRTYPTERETFFRDSIETKTEKPSEKKEMEP